MLLTATPLQDVYIDWLLLHMPPTRNSSGSWFQFESPPNALEPASGDCCSAHRVNHEMRRAVSCEDAPPLPGIRGTQNKMPFG